MGHFDLTFENKHTQLTEHQKLKKEKDSIRKVNLISQTPKAETLKAEALAGLLQHSLMMKFCVWVP